MLRISRPPSQFSDVSTSREPSGDQSGLPSKTSLSVSWTGAPPFRSSTKISGSPSRSDGMAIDPPGFRSHRIPRSRRRPPSTPVIPPSPFAETLSEPQAGPNRIHTRHGRARTAIGTSFTRVSGLADRRSDTVGCSDEVWRPELCARRLAVRRVDARRVGHRGGHEAARARRAALSRRSDGGVAVVDRSSSRGWCPAA